MNYENMGGNMMKRKRRKIRRHEVLTMVSCVSDLQSFTAACGKAKMRRPLFWLVVLDLTAAPLLQTEKASDWWWFMAAGTLV